MSVAKRVRVQEVGLLCDHWSVLKTTRFDFLRRDGHWQTQQRETYDRGNGAAILLYDLARRSVVLTRQFRYPAFVNGIAWNLLNVGIVLYLLARARRLGLFVRPLRAA